MRLSSNLYKAGWVLLDQSDARVIDNNELSEQKIQSSVSALKKKRKAEKQIKAGNETPADSFSEGINAEQIEQLTEPREDPDEDEISEEEHNKVSLEIEAELENARAQAQEIIDHANAEAAEVEENARQSGDSRGYEEGLARAQAEAAELNSSIEERRALLEEDFKKQTDLLEPEMVDALTRIYEHVFDVDLKSDKSIILHLLQNALSKISPDQGYIVHISTDDYDTVSAEKENLMADMGNPNATIELIEDSMLKENECVIETNAGVFDCSLGVELEELSRKLRLLSFERRK